MALAVPATVQAVDYELSSQIELTDPDNNADDDYSPGGGSGGNGGKADRIVNVDDTVVSADEDVDFNHGYIGTNENGVVVDIILDTGTLNINKGTVNCNDGTVNSNLSLVGNRGLVTDNFGTVQTEQTAPNAEVTNNYDNATVESGAAINQFWSVTISEFENGGAVFGGGFVHKDVTDKDYLLDKDNPTNAEHSASAEHKTGTITITPANGYRVSQTTGNDGPTTCQYSVAKSGNKYIVTISAVEGITELTLAQLNLVIEEIEQGGGENVVVRVDPSIQIVEDETRSNRAVSDTAPATGNVVTAAQISAMIESALAANPNATVLDLDLGNDPSFTADTLIALCEKNNVAKRCHFTHNGMKFVLFIPVVDPTSAAYQQCKALLDAEEGKQAGPIRLSYLFAPVKFSLSQE